MKYLLNTPTTTCVKISNKKFKKIGIVGGAGPAASCLLYQLIIDHCQQTFMCKNDSDFPEMIILNYPFSKMVVSKEAKENKEQLHKELLSCLNVLAMQQCNVIGIACNTLHTFLSHKTTQFPVARIDVAVKQYLKNKNIKKVFVLGTSTTARSNLYCSVNKLDFIFPSKELQKLVTNIIKRILTGIVKKTDMTALKTIIKCMHKQEPFDGVLLACTELSVLNALFPMSINDIKIFDALSILAEVLLKKAA